MNRHEFLKTVAVGGASILASRWAWGDQPAEPKTFTYKTAGGCDIKLDAFGSDPNVRKPVIVHIHGGALISGRKGQPKWLTPNGGHVLISIDYRLAPETKLPAIVEDVQDAFRWIHQEGPQQLNINADKLAVAGESAGGYLTLMAGFCVKPRPRALVAISGYGRIVSAHNTHPDPFYLEQPRVSKEDAYASVGAECLTEPPPGSHRDKFVLYCQQNGIWPKEVTGHDPATEPKWFKHYCPVENVSSQYPPTFLVHGTADTDVPYEESKLMDEALTRFKVEHKFITIPGGAHVLMGLAPNEKDRIYGQALDFVKAHLS
jgi:acetyl esterase/lipase